jgi:hypothetical protein
VFLFAFYKRKVSPPYSRTDLPIHAKIGREWGPIMKTCARLTVVEMTCVRGGVRDQVEEEFS